MQAMRNLIDGVQELALIQQSAPETMTGEGALRWLAKVSPIIDALDQLQQEAADEMDRMARERFENHCLAWERDE